MLPVLACSIEPLRPGAVNASGAWMSDEIFPNGVNGLTGEVTCCRRSPPPTCGARRVEDPDDVNRLKRVHGGLTEPTYRLPFDVDPEVVAEAGWAVVYSEGEDAVRAEVDALVEHRRAQIGDAKVKGSTTSRASGGRSGSTATAPHPAMSIRKIPYYVLLVGSPARSRSASSTCSGSSTPSDA